MSSLFHIGTNDLLQGSVCGSDHAASRRADGPDSRTPSDRPFDRRLDHFGPNTESANTDPQLFASNDECAGLAGDRAGLVAISSLLYGRPDRDSVGMGLGGIHPNDSGYGKMAGCGTGARRDARRDAPPTVGLTYPFDNSSVSGQIRLSASAFDDFCSRTDVAFAIDGVPNLHRLSAPFETTWNSPSVPNGPHTMRVTARDSAGQTRIQIVRFTAVNPLVDTALMAEFGFEESDGATAFDGSGRGNHAALSGITRTRLDMR